MDFGPAGTGRMVVALGVLGVLALSVWLTMDAGQVPDADVGTACVFCVSRVAGLDAVARLR